MIHLSNLKTQDLSRDHTDREGGAGSTSAHNRSVSIEECNILGDNESVEDPDLQDI